jgi:enoyl-CoA hydratase
MVGSYKARKLFYTGEFATAERCTLGAVEQVVPHDQLLPAANDLARRIAEKSPIAMRLAKESLNRVEYMPLKEAYRTEQDYTNRLRGFEDSREAMRAFAEKRAPEWKWR